MLDETHVRQEKLARLMEVGLNPYPNETQRDTACGEAVRNFDAWSVEQKQITLGGRILTIRVHGGMMFADLADESGKIQLAFKQDEIGNVLFEQFRDLIDPGDFVEATGVLFLTKRGEKSLQVGEWRPLAKALLPLPEKWHGLKDVEARFREREMDLISNPEVRHRFVVRSRVVTAFRKYLDERGFLEVETPILHPIPGGANARPFATHHNALDADFYLRIAPELYLKRLVVGGFEKVYEIGRCFRNEGIDHEHNPEFTMLELYQAYASKDVFVTFLEELLKTVTLSSVGSLTIEQEGGKTIDFDAPWKRTTFRDAIKEACGIDIDTIKNEKDLLKAVKAKSVTVDFSDCHGMGEYFDALYKKTARPALVQPTWVFDYPVDLKPLAAVSEDDPTKSASVQLIVEGAEIMNAYYHELHDPSEQRKRLMDQQALVAAGSSVAQRIDEPFLSALEHGMPPTSGMGIGIDRFVSVITGAPSLKEVILFPTLRPLSSVDETESVKS